MKQSRLLPLIPLMLSVLVTSSACADNGAGKFAISGVAGASRHFGTPGSTSTLFGVRFDAGLDENVFLEGEASRLGGKSYLLTAGPLYRFVEKGRFALFGTVGAGAIMGSRAGAAIDFGVGSHLFLADNLALRLDLRDLIAMSRVENNLVGTVGLSYFFGAATDSHRGLWRREREAIARLQFKKPQTAPPSAPPLPAIPEIVKPSAEPEVMAQETTPAAKTDGPAASAAAASPADVSAGAASPTAAAATPVPAHAATPRPTATAPLAAGTVSANPPAAPSPAPAPARGAVEAVEAARGEYPLPNLKPVLEPLKAPPVPELPWALPEGIVMEEAVAPPAAATVSAPPAPEAAAPPTTPQAAAAPAPAEPIASHTVFFARGSSLIPRKDRQELTTIAEKIKRTPGTRVFIEGHTDSSGSRAFNMELSQRRAQSIRTFLLAAGVPSATISVGEYGPTRPNASNITKEGRQKNRRGVVKVYLTTTTSTEPPADTGQGSAAPH